MKKSMRSKCKGGTAPPTPQLACFVLYVKIIKILKKTNKQTNRQTKNKKMQYTVCILLSIFQGTQKSIKIKVDQTVLD